MSVFRYGLQLSGLVTLYYCSSVDVTLIVAFCALRRPVYEQIVSSSWCTLGQSALSNTKVDGLVPISIKHRSKSTGTQFLHSCLLTSGAYKLGLRVQNSADRTGLGSFKTRSSVFGVPHRS
jgi:hypothetical protein